MILFIKMISCLISVFFLVFPFTFIVISTCLLLSKPIFQVKTGWAKPSECINFGIGGWFYHEWSFVNKQNKLERGIRFFGIEVSKELVNYLGKVS